MISSKARPQERTTVAFPGQWEGDLIIGEGGRSAAATPVERTSRFVMILGLSERKQADLLIDHINDMSDLFRASRTWDQGTELACHAAIALATKPPIYLTHPHCPSERPASKNTNGLIRVYLPKGIHIAFHQPYLDAIAEELNERPRAVLGFRTPREVFTKLKSENVA